MQILIPIVTFLVGLVLGIVVGGIMSMAKDYSHPDPEIFERYKKNRE